MLVGALGLEGVVKSMHDGSAEVDVRGKRLRAKLRRPARRHDRRGGGRAAVARARQRRPAAARRDRVTELNLIGNNVDEALTRLETVLRRALITETKTLRIVHGYGTGQLRRAVADFLKTHPLVASFGPAPENQGAGGATVVELKD